MPNQTVPKKCFEIVPENISQSSGPTSTSARDKATKPVAAFTSEYCSTSNWSKVRLPSATVCKLDSTKLVRSFNLALKTVPIKNTLGENIVSGRVQLCTLAVDIQGNSAPKVVSAVDTTRGAKLRTAVPLTCSDVKEVKFPATSKTATPCGTLGDWKMNGANLAKSPNNGAFLSDHAKTKRTTTTFGEATGRWRRKEWRCNSSLSTQLKASKEIFQYINVAKIDAYCLPRTVHMNRSLGNASYDFEARDRAARETLEASVRYTTESPPKNVSDKDLRPLSSFTEDSFSTDKRIDCNLLADPMLTSAAYGSPGDDNDMVMDLVLAEVTILPARDMKSFGSITDKEKGDKDLNEPTRSFSSTEFVMYDNKTSGRIPNGHCTFPESGYESGCIAASANDDRAASTAQTCSSRRQLPNNFSLLPSTQKMQLGACKCVKRKSNIVTAPKNALSTKRDLRRRERKAPTSIASMDCSVDKCVTTDDAWLGNTQVETWDTNRKSDHIEIEKLRAKPVETWKSEEVSTWLRTQINRFKTERILSAATDQDPAIPGADVCLKTLGTLFSRVTDGETLRNLSLDKLQQCSGNRSLAVYLFDKLKELVTSGRPATKGKAMHRGGYYSLQGTPTVHVTSAEQLEEAVNFDDLLGSDGIFGTLGLNEELDSHAGSYLRSLGTDGENRVHLGHVPPRALSSYHNDFSPVPRPVYQSTHYRQSFVHSLPPPCDIYTHNHLDTTRANVVAAPCGNRNGYGFLNRSESFVPPPPTPTKLSPACRPVSPSTFYNLSTVPSASLTPGRPDDDRCRGDYVVSQSRWTHSAPENYMEAVNSRDNFMSDNDSGVYSPGVIHSKVAAKVADFSQDLTVHRYNDKSASAYGHKTPPYSIPNDGLWMQPNDGNVSMQIFTMSAENVGIARRKSVVVVDANGEAWERASISSTTSTLSAECETKLLNMDDCKTYVTRGYGQPRLQQFRRGNGGDAATCSPKEGTVIAQQTGTFMATSKTACDARSEGSQQVATQTNTASEYPAFASHIRCPNPVPQAPAATSQGEVASRALHGKYVESNDAAGPLTDSPETATRKVVVANLQNAGVDLNTPLICDQSCGGQTAAYNDVFDFKRRTSGKSVHLWEFIRDILLNPCYCPSLIRWEDRSAGIFRFVQSDAVAGMWGDKKNNPKMTYEKLSRAMRYYYNRGILERVDGRRLVYKFGKQAHGWQQHSEGDKTNSAHREETPGVRQGVRSKRPNKSTKPSPKRRKSESCRIPVSVSKDIIPSTKKRRRESKTTSPSHDSLIDHHCQKTDEARVLPASSTKIEAALKHDLVAKTKEDDSMFTDPARAPQIAGQTSCIVYVARPEQMISEVERKEEISIFDRDASKWSPDPLTEQQGRLPSAEVLLGKQFRVATAAI